MVTGHAKPPGDTSTSDLSPFKVSFTLRGTLAGEAIAAMQRGIISAAEAMQRAGFAIARAACATRALPIPEVHSFRPDFDLRCTVKHCGLGPEEHR